MTIVGDYVKPNSTLTTMNRIHRELTGTQGEFGRWQQVQEEYGSQEWDDNSFEEFLRVCRQYVEGDIEEISEAYLDILEPEELSQDLITDTLKSNLAGDEVNRREGFQYRRRDDGRVSASYYYFTTDIEITENLEIEDIPNQKRIPLKFDPERRLIIVETTMPARVQKAKSVINEKTILDVATTGNLNLVEQEAESRVRSFIDSFERADTDSAEEQNE